MIEARSAETDRTARTVRSLGLLALALGVLWLLSDVLLLIFAAILIAIGLRRSAFALNRRISLSANVWVGVIGSAIVGLCGLAAWRWGGELIAHLDTWTNTLDQNFALLRDQLEATRWGRSLLQDVTTSKLFSSGASVAGNLAGVAMSTFGVAGSTLIVLATAVYLAIDPRLYEDGAVLLSPVPYRRRFRQILCTIGDSLAYWLLGRLIDMLAVFILALGGLWLLGVPAALPLAMIAALLNFVPYIGAFAGAAPAVLAGLGQGAGQAASVAILFFCLQMLEGYLISPMIQKRTVALPPAITILSQTVFGALFGVLGILLAPALAVACMAAIRMGYVEDVLESKSSKRRSRCVRRYRLPR